MCKLVSSGQGGFCVTTILLWPISCELRTHGLASTFSSIEWNQLGCNFRYNDILASLCMSQLQKVDAYIESHKHLYSLHRNLIIHPKFLPITPQHRPNEIPIYHEFLVDDRAAWLSYLSSHGVQARPSIHTSKQIILQGLNYSDFVHSSDFSLREYRFWWPQYAFKSYPLCGRLNQ